MTNPLFDNLIKRVLPIEGGYTRDRADAGNWTGGVVGKGKLNGTNYGISAASYPTLDIERLTWPQAVALYRRDFWERVQGDKLPAAFAFQALDAAINHGTGNSARWIQRAAGVADDGVIGNVTLAAVARMNVADLVLLFNAIRTEFYASLTTFDRYGRGWTRRIADNLRFAAGDN